MDPIQQLTSQQYPIFADDSILQLLFLRMIRFCLQLRLEPYLQSNLSRPPTVPSGTAITKCSSSTNPATQSRLSLLSQPPSCGVLSIPTGLTASPLPPCPRREVCRPPAAMSRSRSERALESVFAALVFGRQPDAGCSHGSRGTHRVQGPGAQRIQVTSKAPGMMGVGEGGGGGSGHPRRAFECVFASPRALGRERSRRPALPLMTRMAASGARVWAILRARAQGRRAGRAIWQSATMEEDCRFGSLPPRRLPNGTKTARSAVFLSASWQSSSMGSAR